MRMLSFPFRVQPSGRLATVDSDSDEGHAQLLAALILTRLGERPLLPTFGTPDPTFTGFDSADLIAAARVHGPPVSIRNVTARTAATHRQDVTVEFI